MSETEKLLATLASHGERLATLEADMLTLKSRSGSLALWVAAAGSLLAAVAAALALARAPAPVDTATLAREVEPAVIQAIREGMRR